MKRMTDHGVGSRQSAFQPVSSVPRSDHQASLTVTARGAAQSCPAMKVVNRARPAVWVVWQGDAGSNELVWPQSSAEPTLSRLAHDDSVRALVADKANALCRAIHEGKAEAIQAMLKAPDASEIAMVMDAAGKNALFHAIEKNDLFTQDLLLNLSARSEMAMQKSADGLLPLSVAAAKGSVVGVALLLSLSSANEQVMASLETEESKNYSNPLMLAAVYGREPMVRFLLGSPCANLLAAGSCRTGANTLMLATCKGHAGVVQTLLASSFAEMFANFKTRHGINPLMVASIQGNAELVKIFLDSPYGPALSQATSTFGVNALVAAAQRGHKEVVRLLIDFGFVGQQLAARGQSGGALDVAIAGGHQDIAELLRSHGAVSLLSDAGN